MNFITKKYTYDILSLSDYHAQYQIAVQIYLLRIYQSISRTVPKTSLYTSIPFLVTSTYSHDTGIFILIEGENRRENSCQ